MRHENDNAQNENAFGRRSAVALIATVAVGRTIRTHAVADGAHATQGSAINAAPGRITPPQPHATVACSLANEPDCEKIEMLFPE